ncbi:hypothetical protein TWF225_003346 [Orbilia oligospora]|uniref:Uncharacterized protein n=1 Tax=Orbilia oligospora TaxID=2813651 RepID=A0A7C8JYU3_ORBOL|nr:hypothetical protein TWF751_001209 [Orbilia oligospora]KAF3188358.1 hypothetical protein TWF225_003346 [Orbilia oligospora]KAF3240289.1 hypothetical protein TWF217_000872 [Orbilia oligospora]KAF3258508.1 hypothetical protein TWF128_004742 [Orbilia oligospora]KAF3281343.1 hypothetical protein TWF132_011335 [Orbilia oligospora]
MKTSTQVLLSLMAIGASAYPEGTPTAEYSPVVTGDGCPAKYDPNCPYFCNSRGQGSNCSPNFITGPGTPGCFVCPGIPSECPSKPNDSCAYICTGSADINLGPGSPNVFCAPSDASLGPFGDSTTKAITCVLCSDDDDGTPTDPPPSEDTETPTVSPPSEDTETPTAPPPPEDTTTPPPPSEETTTTSTPPPSYNTTTPTIPSPPPPPPAYNTTTPTIPPPSGNTTVVQPPEYTGAASRVSIGGAAILGLATIILFNF